MSRILHVLLCGGVGSRLWPLSRRSMPKQFLEIFSGKSLFQLSVERNKDLTDELILVSNAATESLASGILQKMDFQNHTSIVEATPRNTAPAIAFAAFFARPDDILLITPSDHIINGEQAYKKAISEAVEIAKDDYLVTFGIKPIRAETGYGYLECREHNVLSFREKPDRQTAESFLKRGNFLWNSGMFCFKASVFLNELKKHSPEIYEASLKAWELAEDQTLELESSLEIPSDSIDYAVMEKSSRIRVVKSEFEWSDMGSFEAVYDYLQASGYSLDPNKNMQLGDTKPTFFVGVNNCILISTKDVNLIVSKKSSQDVKAIYEHLAQHNPDLIN